MIHFRYSPLPQELRGLILNRLYDEEAHKLLRVNREARLQVLHRGCFSKYADEIFLWSVQVHYLNIVSMPKNYDHVNSLKSLKKWSLSNREKEWPILAQLTKIRYCRKIRILVYPQACDLGNVFAQMEAINLFANLRHLEYFQIETTPGLMETIFENFHPESVKHFGIFPYPNAASEDSLHHLLHKVFSRTSIQSCKYLNFGRPNMPKWELCARTFAEHVELNCSTREDIKENVVVILELGIPSQNPSASAQIRTELNVNNGDRVASIMFKDLAKMIAVSPNITSIPLDSIHASEIEMWKILRYYSSKQFLFDNFRTYAIARPKESEFWAEERPATSDYYSFFLQKSQNRKYLVMLCVQNIMNQVDVSILWISRS